MNKFGNFLIHSLNTFLGTKAFDGTETEDEAAAKLESFKAPVAQEQEAAIADLTARLTALEAAAPVNTADFASFADGHPPHHPRHQQDGSGRIQGGRLSRHQVRI